MCAISGVCAWWSARDGGEATRMLRSLSEGTRVVFVPRKEVGVGGLRTMGPGCSAKQVVWRGEHGARRGKIK